ncbi:MAG: lysostaphin resistance A-like protein [Promethearchaeota archaeon]
MLISFIISFGCMVLLWFLIIPISLHLPNGDHKFKEYLNIINLTRVKPVLRNVIVIIGCSTIFFISTFLMANLLGSYEFEPNILFREPNYITLEFGWFNFILMLIPGIWEEVSFRGVLFQLNMRKFSRYTTLITTSLLFGLAHFINLIRGQNLSITILQVIFASFSGVLFGYMYLKTKSLLPSITTHYLINTVGMFFMNADFQGNFITLSIFYIFGAGLIPLVFGSVFVKLITLKSKNKKS